MSISVQHNSRYWTNFLTWSFAIVGTINLLALVEGRIQGKGIVGGKGILIGYIVAMSVRWNSKK